MSLVIDTPIPPADLTDTVAAFGQELGDMVTRQGELAEAVGIAAESATRLTLFHQYIWVFVIAFSVTIIATPIMRRIAMFFGVIDHPTDPRKVHRMPIAYLGGVAVYLGLIGGILFSSIALRTNGLMQFHEISNENLDLHFRPHGVSLSILFGLTIIMVIGLWDDVSGIPPLAKVGGQLMAAAALAMTNVGVSVAKGVLMPIGELMGNPEMLFSIPIPALGGFEINGIYWVGTAIIAVFVIGGCNASNLVDGLDGLLTGITAIAATGLLFIALTLALLDDGDRDAQRIVLCLALLGACLGFLPHNFNPATIFLGDCGSLLLGFTTIVIILTLGDTGKTHLVFAGLFIYAIPIIDTVLAIIRRKMSGASISDADDQHLHHMLKRSLGVKGAVLTLYAIGIGFAVLGVAMSLGRARVAYALALLFAAYIGVTAFKIARLAHIESDAHRAVEQRNGAKSGRPGKQTKIAQKTGT